MSEIVLSFRDDEYRTDGDDLLHKVVKFCHEPRMSGPVVGWRQHESGECKIYLIELTVPYGEDSGVFVTMPDVLGIEVIENGDEPFTPLLARNEL